MSAIHRIRRQRWQVKAGSAADAFAVRALLRREHEAPLLPAIEAAFAACDSGQEIRLPRLEIKLGISSLENMADELPVRLAEAVRLALSEALDGLPSVSSPTRMQPTPAARLRHYLSTGRVDWFDADRETAPLREQLAAAHCEPLAGPALQSAGQDPTLGDPHQLRAATAFSADYRGDHGAAELLLERFDQQPCASIAHVHAASCGGNRTGFGNALQQIGAAGAHVGAVAEHDAHLQPGMVGGRCCQV
ncbi:MAG: hypothetical protein J0L65_14000 [Xanthomonadales bacterium]|nr:hypothetical protein [Xanthomonadales bacterium]